MSNPSGDCAQSTHEEEEEEEHEGELLCLKIKDKLEDMFSDGHLAQDGFLLKHVQRNKEGYVSLKLLTSLKKIKVLTTDWYMTLAGAEYSELLEVNEECTKVRRKEPLPQWLLCSPTSKLLLVQDISEEQTGDDEVASGLLSERFLQKFSAYGNITSTWILCPGKELPAELQKYAKHHRELGQNLCAVVKFEHLEAVRKVCSGLTEEEKSYFEGKRVVPLGRLSVHHVPREENIHGSPGDEDPHDTSANSAQEESSLTLQDSEILNTPKPQENNSIQDTLEQISSSCKGQSSALKKGCDGINLSSGDCSRDTSHCPWVLQRRKLEASTLSFGGDRNAQCFRVIVLRMPLGPDGSKGFLRRRGGNQTVPWMERCERR